MIEFITKNNLDLNFKTKKDLSKETKFEIRAALGSNTDFDKVYNTPRAWFMHRYLSPKKYKWEGPIADFTPESDDLPWSLKPDHKITIEDIKYIMSSYYQGTEFNPYNKHGSLLNKGKYRPIGINRNDFVTLTHIRPYVPDEIKSLEWIAVSSCSYNVFIPQYARVNDSPKYLNDVTIDVSTENFYWQNRLIAALADPHYNEAMVWIDRYQNKMAAKGHELINLFDKKYLEKNDKKVLENANEEICNIFKKETTDVLGKVLHTVRKKKKNAYSRSDA